MSKMKKCQSCSREIASNAKTCPGCGAKNKKPIYKRAWFIVVAFLIVVSAIGSMGNDDSTPDNSGTTGSEQEISQNNGENAPAQEKAPETEKVEDTIPTEYKSALRKAKSYSDNMHMSKTGIYNQLTSEYGEKFSAEAAQYAIDNVKADWNANALKKAKSYQENMAMSPSAIYDQLISEYGEKFTPEEAQYAVDNLE